MGWRETLGAAVSGSKPIDEIDKTDKTPLFVNSVNFVNAPENGNPPGSPAAVPAGTGLREALAAACDGLPLSLEELTREFGAEGAADWAEGYTPHCQPEFLRAFAVAVSERLARERAAEPGANTPTHNPQNTQNPEPDPLTPGPLDGLPLLREDRRFIEGRTRGRHREALLGEYGRRWSEAAAAEPVEFRKANAGRRAANAWLREAGR